MNFRVLVPLVAVTAVALSCTGSTEYGQRPIAEIEDPKPRPLVPKKDALALEILATEGSYLDTGKNDDFARIKGQKGTVVIDASGGHHRMPIAKGVREFANAEEFLRWTQTTLHFQTEIGDREGLFEYRSETIGRPTWHHALRRIDYDVADPILAMIGGITGFVAIGEQAVCLDPDGSCEDGLASYLVPRETLIHGATVDDCDSDDRFCARYHSFFNTVDLGFFRYGRHGGNTSYTGSLATAVEPESCEDEAPPDSSVERFEIELLTGGDDLRGGEDNAFAFVTLDDGRVFTLVDLDGRERSVNDGATLQPGRNHRTTMRLPTAVPLGQIRTFGLRTNFGGGDSGDNWDLAAVRVTVNGGAPFLFRDFEPDFRFTGTTRTWEQAVRFDAPSADTVIRAVTLRVETGSDDLRGGSDNAFARLILADGSETVEQMINSDSRGISGGERTTLLLPLPSDTRIRDLRELAIRTTFGGGTGGDNWDVDQVRLDAALVGGSTFNLLLESGSPEVRFTGSLSRQTWPLAEGRAPATCGSISTLDRHFLRVDQCNIVRDVRLTPGSSLSARIVFQTGMAEASAADGSVEVAIGGAAFGVISGDLDPSFVPGGARPGGGAPPLADSEVNGICCAHSSSAGSDRTGNGNHEIAASEGRCP